MLLETNKDKGRAGFVSGIAYFGANGYTVSIPLNDTQWYDFVAEKDGRFYTVQCKSAADNDLRLYGDTFDIIKDGSDFLFCMDGEKNMYCIPVADLEKCGNRRSVRLCKEPGRNKRRNALPVWKYLVTL